MTPESRRSALISATWMEPQKTRNLALFCASHLAGRWCRKRVFARPEGAPLTAVFIFIAVQIATTGALALFARRRFDALEREIVRLRELVENNAAAATAKPARARAARQASLVAADASAGPPDIVHASDDTLTRSDV